MSCDPGSPFGDRITIEPGKCEGKPCIHGMRITVYDVLELREMTEIAERITVNPNQCGGRPCIRGMRIGVVDVLDLLAAGLTPQEVVAELPDLGLDDVQACLRYASRRLSNPGLAA